MHLCESSLLPVVSFRTVQFHRYSNLAAVGRVEPTLRLELGGYNSTLSIAIISDNRKLESPLQHEERVFFDLFQNR